MYSREILPPPSKFIQNGHAIFGTFQGCPEELNIRGVRSPFNYISLPHCLTDFRIRSNIFISFELCTYIGFIDFHDEKVFGYADVVFWHKETGRRLSYKILMGPRRRFIPHQLTKGCCSSYNPSKYLRISWDHSRDRISVVFNFKGNSTMPDACGALTGHFNDSASGELTTVIPYPTKRKCSATYNAVCNIHGTLSAGKSQLLSEDTVSGDGTLIFRMNRSFYDLYNVNHFVCGNGTIDGKNVSFVLGEALEDAVEPDTYNDNYLIYDGQITPLPPVTITHPNKDWIIQDTENMVDLTFTPVSENVRDLAIILFRSKITTICGTFEGTLRTKDDQVINLNGFAGLNKKSMMRV